ncbi:MAG: PHP domain-containing protein [Rectinema sp.]
MNDPEELDRIINDARNEPILRLEALAQLAEMMGPPAARSGESNNHIHTCYSFSPYTPSGAALAARRAGLDVAGSVDHDSYAAASEMRAACALLDIGVVTGFELRVSLSEAARNFPEKPAMMLTTRKLNNPDSIGIIYMTIQGIPAPALKEVEVYLSPIRAARYRRSALMAELANKVLFPLELPEIDFEKDIVADSKYTEGGTITERHLLAAVARSILSEVEPGQELIKWLEEKLSLVLTGSQKRNLSESQNPYLVYDLLGVLKAGFLDSIFIQPTEECVDVRDAISFANRIGGIPAYAYLGDVAESPTGDKRAEKFEDEILDELIPVLKELGFPAITYMPPRNTKEQLLRLQGFCKKYDLMEISGVDINQPRQSFRCPELLLPEFRHLDDATWAMVAHEALSGFDLRFGLFSAENSLADIPITERIHRYATVGRAIDFREPGSLVRQAELLFLEK